jgi:hypothetical protein
MQLFKQKDCPKINFRTVFLMFIVLKNASYWSSSQEQPPILSP